MKYYAAYSGNSLCDVSGQPIGSIFKNQEFREEKPVTGFPLGFPL